MRSNVPLTPEKRVSKYKRLVLCLCLLTCVGCSQDYYEWPSDTPDQPTPISPIYVPNSERPQVNPPFAIRQSNWTMNGSGSCVHATMITVLRWQNRNNMAEHWKQTYGSGETAEGLAVKMEREGIRYAYTSGEKDVTFLEWACSTRRGCGVTCMGGSHCIMLCHLDDKWACLLDDNAVDHYTWVPRERFLAEWFTSDSWAFTVIYAPPAPLPQR